MRILRFQHKILLKIWTIEKRGFQNVREVITEKIYKYVPEGSKILDVFSGTSAIVYALKDKYEICANDAEIFCKNIGETLLAKDGYLINLYKKTGEIVQMLSIGHAPYSACVIRDNYLFVGGGEPPVNGLLRAFLLNDHSVKNEL